MIQMFDHCVHLAATGQILHIIITKFTLPAISHGVDTLHCTDDDERSEKGNQQVVSAQKI